MPTTGPSRKSVKVLNPQDIHDKDVRTILELILLETKKTRMYLSLIYDALDENNAINSKDILEILEEEDKEEI